jgi:hypothetical protein
VWGGSVAHDTAETPGIHVEYQDRKLIPVAAARIATWLFWKNTVLLLSPKQRCLKEATAVGVRPCAPLLDRLER